MGRLRQNRHFLLDFVPNQKNLEAISENQPIDSKKRVFETLDIF